MRLFGATICIFLFAMTCHGAVLYGLASPFDAQAETYTPSHLYRLDLNGTSFVDLGPVLFNGSAAEFDGLAASHELGIVAFRSDQGGPRLVQIDPNAPAATDRGPPLFGRDIRGATFDASDELWAVDANLNELVRVSPATGEEFDVVPLTLNGQPFDLPQTTDLAVRFSGQMILVAAQDIYEVDKVTGEMSLVFTDSEGEPTPASLQPPIMVGAAIGYAGAEKLFSFDVEGSFADDLYTYDLTNGYARDLLTAAPLSQVDAVLGDLALLMQPVSTGDYNQNGVVDAADYTVWRDSLGSTTVLLANGVDSGTSMNVIDQADYDLWVNNFGNIVGSASLGLRASQVPEPSQLGIWLLLSFVATRWRSGRANAATSQG